MSRGTRVKRGYATRSRPMHVRSLHCASAFKCSQTLVVAYDECASSLVSSLFQRGTDVMLNAKKRTRTCEYHKKGLRNPAVDQTPIEEIQRGRRNR